MDFPFGRTVTRLRAGLIEDPYNPDEQIRGDWENPEDPLPIPRAFVAHTSTSLLQTATRDQAAESKSLFCNGSFDVQQGDRIQDGDVVYTIDGIPPAADTNPWTGWTPPREITLTRYVG
jgi:hypothetical protein